MTQHSRKGPASAGPFRVIVVALAVVAAACAVGGKKADEGALPADKAVPAQPLLQGADAEPTVTTVSGGTATTSRGGPSTTVTTASTGGGAGATTTTTVPFTARLDIADRTGDAGLQAKPYGDLTRLRLDDDGSRARFTLELAAAIPAPLAADEQLHVNVDLYRGGTESDYQVHAEGNSDGWRAWLHDPSDFVEYRGTFEVGDNRLVFTVPWSALGGRKAGTLSALVEWDKERIAVVADSSSDGAPDSGSTPYRF